MAEKQFEGRSAAEAAINACEELGVTRSELRYNVVSEKGEGIDRWVVIAVDLEQLPQARKSEAEAPPAEAPPRSGRRDQRERRSSGRRSARNGGAQTNDRGGGARRRGRGGGRQRSTTRRKPEGAKPAKSNGIDDLINVEAFAGEAGEQRPDVDAELSPRAQKAKEVVTELVGLMGLKLTTHVVQDDAEEIHIDIRGDDEGRLIGKKFEALLSLQFLVNRIVCRQVEGEQVVVLDAAGYRAKRRAALADLAKRLAERAVQEQKVVKLSPMSAHDRRVFHLTLTEQGEVTTRSEGDGLYRNLLIIPSEFDRPRPN